MKTDVKNKALDKNIKYDILCICQYLTIFYNLTFIFKAFCLESCLLV